MTTSSIMWAASGASYLFVFLSIAVSSVKGQACPDGWALGGDSCYIGKCGPITGGTAVDDACALIDPAARAASITSVHEEEAATKAGTDASCTNGGAPVLDFWTGLRDVRRLCNDGNQRTCTAWAWSDGRGAPNPAPGYQRFDTTLMAGDNNDCVFMRTNDGVWDIQLCDDVARVKSYICRMAASSSASLTPSKPKGFGALPACLYGGDEVVREVGGATMIKDLRPGDKVLSLSDAGELVYDEVYLMAHSSPDVVTTFKHIELSNNVTLHVTAKHMLLIDGAEKSADQIQPKDSVYIRNSVTGVLMTERVKSVPRDVVKASIYNPITRGGRLLVNGVLTSSYPALYSTISARHMHNALWVVRMLYDILPVDVINVGHHLPIWVKYTMTALNTLNTL